MGFDGRPSRWIAFGCILLPALQAPAAAPRPVITLEAALERGEQHSPLVRRARRRCQAVAAQQVGAGQWLRNNPQLALSAGGRRDTSGSRPAAQGPEFLLRLEQPLEVAGQRGTRMAEAEAALQVARARLLQARIETRARLRAAYLHLLIRQATAQLAERQQEAAAGLHRGAQSRVELGSASGMELELARAELGRAHAEATQAAAQQQLAQAELAYLLALPEPLDLQWPERPPSEGPDLAAAQAQAARNHAELISLSRTRDAWDASMVRLRREAVPNLSVALEVQTQQPQQTYWGAALGSELPLFARRQGELAVAAAERTAADTELQLSERSIALQVRQQSCLLSARARILQIFEAQVVPAAERRSSLAISGWRAGKLDFVFAVQSLREARDAQRQRLEAVGLLWQARIDLDRATGSL